MNGNKRSTIQARGEQVKEKKKGKWHAHVQGGQAASRRRLEIVPIEIVGLSRPGLRRDKPLRSACAHHRVRSPCSSAAPAGACPQARPPPHSTRARASLRLLLLALLDDLVLAIGGGNTGGAVSSGVAGVGVGSTHSSSSRSAESDEIVCEKSTAVALREIVPPPPIVCAELGVTGPTGSSSVPPPLWLLSDAARKESRSPMATSPASKSHPSPLPPHLRGWTRPHLTHPNPYR